jgi:hypothetical protein
MEGRTDDQKANVFERPLVEDDAFVGHDSVCTRQYSHVCPAPFSIKFTAKDITQNV